MADHPFSATVRQEGAISVIDLVGEINSFADEALNKAYARADAANSAAILLNFSKVSYINSTGIALIVGLLAQARKGNRKLLTCGLSPHYAEIFEITRLSDFMRIYADEASALAEVK